MMLLPFDRAIDWSHPPVATILIVVLNVLAFFAWQHGEDEALQRAATFYQSSGLAELEAPGYRQYLASNLKKRDDLLGEDATVPANIVPSLRRTMVDYEYYEWLKAGLIVSPNSPDYDRWRRNRARLEGMLDEVVYYEYGLKTGDPSIASLFAHMFLHADASHLFGNMFFLFAVGFLVEVAVGPWVFLGCYLLTGLGSAGLDFLLTPNRMIPGVGASGAVAGLVGLYAVLYWTRKVRFFYFIVVYFDYVKLPTIAILPLWIGNELFQIWQHGDYSNINYIAHIGGLLAGALVGIAVRNSLPDKGMAKCEEDDRQQEFQRRLDEARSLCREMHLRKARPLLARLYSEDPRHRETLCLYQEALRIDPSSEEYHRVNQAILELSPDDGPTRTLIMDTLRDYSVNAKPNPRLNQKLVCRLAPMLIQSGRLDDGKRIFRTLLKHGWPCPAAASMLAELCQALEGQGQHQEAEPYRALLKTL